METSEVLIQKFLRDKTGLSRRAAGEAIANGEVKKNGKLSVLGERFDPTEDIIEYKGKKLQNLEEEKIYIMLNKPIGYITSRFDPHNKKTVYKLLPQKYANLFPVGRLDLNTEGLLILTNDGDFTYKMTHPKFEIEKEYYVELDGKLQPNQILKIEAGINTEDIHTSNAKILEHRIKNGKSSLRIILHEGQKREVRRIFNAFGLEVTYLRRDRLGIIRLQNLQVGAWKLLDSAIII